VLSDITADTQVEADLLFSHVYPEKVMVGGGFSSIVDNLVQMATPNVSKFTYSDFMRAFALRKHHLSLPKMGNIEHIDRNKVRLNPDAYPGYVFDLACGNTRQKCKLMSSKITKIAFSKILKSKQHSRDLWRFSVKPKSNTLSHDVKRLKARPVALCDDVLVRIGGCIAQAITDKLHYCPKSEFFIGRSMSLEDRRYLEAQINVFGRQYASPDFSQYDNYNYEEVMVVACSILSSLFDDTSSNSNY